MATTKKKTAVPELAKSNPAPTDTIVVNNMPIILRNVDRTLAGDVGSWWDALRQAEKVINPIRSRLYDVYKTVIIDGHLTGLIEKRIGSVINKEICFKKDDKEQEEFDAITDHAEFRRMLRELMLQKFWGISGFEFIPGDTFTFNCIPRKHIKPELKQLITNQTDQSGYSYDGVWNIWVVGQPDDYGLLLKCAPYVIWKKGNMGDWAQYIEIFGQPFVVGKYSGFDEKTKLQLDETMRNFGGSNRMMIPNEAGIEIIDGKTSNGNGDLQDKFRQACNEELSVLVLGATETTSSSDSSGYAQSKTHAKQQDIILKADMIDIEDYLNSDQFRAILKTYGYNTDGGKFSFEQELDTNEVKAKLDIITQTSKLTPVADDFIYETTNIPKPDNYDELKKQKQAAAVPPADPNAPPTDPNDPNEPDEPNKPAGTFWQRLKAVFQEAP